MYSNPIQHVYIADGFPDDCELLMQKCLAKQDILDFQSFCLTWKEMNMGCLYQGRNSGAEVAELSEEVLQIAKHYMVANTSNYEESVAGLFLVYSLLNLQPYPGFASLRLVPEDVAAITRLETVARRERRYDVLYILASVLIKGPCQYHAAERERGMEASIKKYLDGFSNFDRVRGVRPKGVFYRQNEELDIIRELGSLTKRYSDAKAAVVGAGPSDKGLQYIDEHLPSELNFSLRRIISGIIDEDTDASGEENDDNFSKSHLSRIEEIKARAMKNVVDPIRHLTGIEDRKNQNPNLQSPKSKLKTKPGQVKTSSPNKPQSQIKRKPSPIGNEHKKSRTDLDGGPIKSEENSNTEVFHIELFQDDDKEGADDKEEVDDQKKGNVNENEELVVRNDVDFEIDSYPAVIRTEQDGQIYEIEIIKGPSKSTGSRDKETLEEKNTKTDIAKLSLPDLSTIHIDKPAKQSNPNLNQKTEPVKPDPSQIQEEYKRFQMSHGKRLKRDPKKTHLKSKLKRLGVLPVANFEDSESK
ncbi:uncharacterized protein Pbp45 isoform X2 [Battus philenor]|uniref:uncharacterized protein Pbp45 isoform X2 n=1 Tax=Battus philenor TaxID=42288 RepID=UPI0035CEA2A9